MSIEADTNMTFFGGNGDLDAMRAETGADAAGLVGEALDDAAVPLDPDRAQQRLTVLRDIAAARAGRAAAPRLFYSQYGMPVGVDTRFSRIIEE